MQKQKRRCVDGAFKRAEPEGKQRVKSWIKVLCTANAEAVARSLAEDPTLIDEINQPNGLSALHFAAAHGSCDVTALLLATKPALIDAVDVDGDTPLHLAAESGYDSVAKILLAAKPALALVANTTKGINALHSAAMHGHYELARLLLAACPSSIDTVDYEGITPLLHGYWSDKLMHLFLAANPKNLNALDRGGNNILHCVVKAGRGDYVEQLLAMRPDLIHSLTDEGDTPLHLAMGLDADKHKQLIEKLLTLHPQAVRVTNTLSQTPFHLAVKQNKDSLMDLLQWGLSFDEVADSFSRFYKSFSKRLKPLIEVQCTPLLGKDVMGTVLDYLGLGPVVKQPAPEKVQEWLKAANEGDASTVSRLLAEEPTLIDTIDQGQYDGYTALHFAARQPGREGIVVQLLAAKPALTQAVNANGATALHLAARAGRVRTVEILLAANPSSALAVDYRGNTALHYAAKRGEVVDLLLAACPTSLDFINLSNQTALLIAVSDYNPDFVSRLLAANPKNVEATDSAGRNAFHYCVAGNHWEHTMRLLEIQPGLISTRTLEGDTPLHLAVAFASTTMMRRLFELDPQAVKVANQKGLTPLQIAANSQDRVLLNVFDDLQRKLTERSSTQTKNLQK